MFEVLSDPFWQFIIISFLTVISIGIPLYLYIKQKNEKQISYEILSISSLFSTKPEYAGRLQVLFDGRNVTNVKLILLKIINSGSVPIPSSDYEMPLKISFDNTGEILTAEVTETNPTTINQSIVLSSDEVKINPALLNAGDYIILKIVSTHDIPKINVGGRIIGVKNIQRMQEPIYPGVLIMIGSIAAIIGFFAAIVSSTYFIFFALLGYILMFIGMSTSKRMRARFFRNFERSHSKN